VVIKVPEALQRKIGIVKLKIRIQTPLVSVNGSTLKHIDEVEIAHGHNTTNIKLTSTSGQSVQIPQANEYVFEIQAHGAESLTYVLRSGAQQFNQQMENGKQVTRITCQ
jgi:hypothetical protein